MESGIPNTETNNDSDSSDKSWVLVDENPSENSQNTFVLNCNREPILELTQEELGAEVSDGEFDVIEQDGSSDGISVISDEDVDLDYPIEEKLVETLTNDNKNRVYVHSSNNRINKILNAALALSFITALSLGLGHYIGSTFDCSSNTIIDVDKLYDENEALKSRLLMLQNNDCHQSEQDDVAEHCLMPDNLGSLQTLKKDVENKEVGSDNINNDPVANIQPVMNENPDLAIETKEYLPETEDIVKQKKATKENGEAKKENKKRHIKEKKEKLKYKNEYDDDDDEIDERPKKWKKQNKLNSREGDDYRFKKWKKDRKPLDDEFENIDEDDDDEDDDKKIKKWKKDKKKKNYQEDSYKKSKNPKHRSHVNKNCEDRKKGNKLSAKGKLNDTEYINGEWMEKLAEARKEYRQNTKRSEWIFDRANARKNSRNKAKWYFDRMWDREVYRQQSL